MIEHIFIYGDTAATSKQLYGVAPVSPDPDGVRWALFDIDGWNNSADVKPAVFERPGHDGAVLDQFSYAARTLELHGGLVAPTQTATETAMDWLMQAFDTHDSSYGSVLKQLIVTGFASGPSVVRQILVRRMAAIEAKYSMNGLACEFRVPLIAPDPRKYVTSGSGVTRSGTGAMTATMGGNFPVFPSNLRIDGPITDPVVSHDRTGRLLKLNATIGSGTHVDINMQTHEIVGTLRSRLDVTSRYFPLLPGANVLTLSGSATGAGTAVTASWNDAYQ